MHDRGLSLFVFIMKFYEWQNDKNKITLYEIGLLKDDIQEHLDTEAAFVFMLKKSFDFFLFVCFLIDIYEIRIS